MLCYILYIDFEESLLLPSQMKPTLSLKLSDIEKENRIIIYAIGILHIIIILFLFYDHLLYIYINVYINIYIYIFMFIYLMYFKYSHIIYIYI